MNPWKITTGVLAVTTAFFAFETVKDKIRINVFMADIEYLFDVFKKNEIELDEFDMIALKNPTIPQKKLKRNGWLL